MLEIEGLLCIGQVAVFYLPQNKLDDRWFTNGDQTPRRIIHDFLMDNYDAYTLEISNTKGFWRKRRETFIFQDENARYEVSFDGKDRIPAFVEFLSHICWMLHEEAIYLTMGNYSYLVNPRKPNEV